MCAVCAFLSFSIPALSSGISSICSLPCSPLSACVRLGALDAMVRAASLKMQEICKYCYGIAIIRSVISDAIKCSQTKQQKWPIGALILSNPSWTTIAPSIPSLSCLLRPVYVQSHQPKDAVDDGKEIRHIMKVNISIFIHIV